MNLVAHVKRKVRKYSEGAEGGRRILIAISGGVDSMVLTDIMARISHDTLHTMGLAHINYGIRPDADEAETLSAQTADKLKCRFHSANFTDGTRLGSFEKWAREVRYAYLAKVAREHGYQWIFTAHHRDDQIETLYMRYMQNADWISMQGIREQLGLIRRPLLNIDKKHLVDYAMLNDLTWIDDPTNRDQRYLRNKIRHSVLPGVRTSEPELIDRLIRISANAKRKFTKLKKDLNIDAVVSGHHPSGYVQIKKVEFLKLSDDKKKIVIKSLVTDYLGKSEISLSGSHWVSFWQFIHNAVTGTVFELCMDIFSIMDRESVCLTCEKKQKISKKKLNRIRKTRWTNHLFKIDSLSADSYEKSSDKRFMVLPENMIADGIFVRQWKKGDIIQVDKDRHHVKVSDLFINHKIPVMEKWKYPVVVTQGDKILWIPGLAHAFIDFGGGKLERNNIKIECLWT